MPENLFLYCEECEREFENENVQEQSGLPTCPECDGPLRYVSSELESGSGPSSGEVETIAPDRDPFLYVPVLRWVAFLFILFVIGSVIGLVYLKAPVNVLTVGGIGVLIAGVLALIYYNRKIRFEKERYEFEDDHLVVRSGSMFSDHSVELPVRKITNVTLTLPFLEHLVFDTGHIRVESAGARGGVVHMTSLQNPAEVYERIQDLMTENGFRLKQDNLILKETPNTIGCLLDSGLNLLRFMDRKRRVYYLYDDCVSYTDGFLTKVQRLIPLENLADTETTQEFVDRLLDIYDITVSCQGTGAKIRFGSLENRDFERRLSDLIEETESLETAERRREHIGEEAEDADRRAAERKQKRESVTERDFRTSLGPDVWRMMVPGFVLLPLCLLGLPIMVILYVMARATTYRVKPDSIVCDFNLLSRKTIEFSNDKITGMLVRENIIDRWMGTVSISFWSIGSDSTINFSHLPRTSRVVERLLEGEGYRDEVVQQQIGPEVHPMNFLLGNPFGLVALLMLLVASIIGGIIVPASFLGIAAVPILGVFFYVWSLKYFEKASCEFYETFVRYKEGYLFKREYYVDYDDVKDVTSTRYAGLDSGTLTMGVAGESKGEGENQVRRSYEVRVKYVNNLFERDEVINDRIGLKKWEPEVLQTSAPEPKNSLAGAVIACGVLMGLVGGGTAATIPAYTLPAAGGVLALFLPIFVGSYWSASVIEFRITPRGIVRESGIFYRTRQTILSENIDHIDRGEGILNKCFGNGTIQIYTAGSSRKEMQLSNTPDYRQLYEQIQDLYQ